MCLAGILHPLLLFLPSPTPQLLFLHRSARHACGEPGRSVGAASQRRGCIDRLMSEGNGPPRLGAGPGARRKGHPRLLAGGLSQIAVKPNKHPRLYGQAGPTPSLREKRLLFAV